MVSTLIVAAEDASELTVSVAVSGGEGRLRVSVHVDGEAVDEKLGVLRGCELRVPGPAAGRHVLTVRAIDERGRWGGASSLLEGAWRPAPVVHPAM